MGEEYIYIKKPGYTVSFLGASAAPGARGVARVWFLQRSAAGLAEAGTSRYPTGFKVAVMMPGLGHLLPFVGRGKARRPHLLPPSFAP